MNEYELLYVLHPRLAVDDVSAVVSRVSGLIEDSGGEVLSTDTWGRRRLAYPIQHELEGTYLYTTFQLLPDGVAALEAGLVISQDVIRHLVVKGVLTAPGTAPPEDLGARASRAPAPRFAEEPEGAGPPAAEPEGREPSSDEAQAEEPATAEPEGAESPAAEEPPAEESPAAEPSDGESPAAEEPPAEEPPSAEAEAAEPSDGESPAEEPPSAEAETEQPTVAEPPADGASTEAAPAEPTASDADEAPAPQPAPAGTD